METSHRLEAAEARLAEHEALPGWRQYRACCGLYTALTRAGWGGAGLLRGGLTHSLHMVYQVCRTWALVIGSVLTSDQCIAVMHRKPYKHFGNAKCNTCGLLVTCCVS